MYNFNGKCNIIYENIWGKLMKILVLAGNY